MVWTPSSSHGQNDLLLVPVILWKCQQTQREAAVSQQFSPSFGNCKFSTIGRKICTLQPVQSFMTHLIQSLPPCMHIHTVNSQDGGPFATLYVLKENNWEPNLHLKHPISVEQGFCQYTISVFMLTLWTHFFGTAEHNSHLTIHPFPLCCLYDSFPHIHILCLHVLGT